MLKTRMVLCEREVRLLRSTGREEMIYYFLSEDGDSIVTEENVRGWFTKELNQNMFTQRRKAVAEAKRRIKARIAELKALLKDMK